MAFNKVLGNKPYMVSIELTTDCPFNCPFCYSKRRYTIRSSWSADLLKIFIKELSIVLNDQKFVTGFGGGEPLTVPMLLAIGLKISLDYGVEYTSFTTNGVLMNVDKLKTIESIVGKLVLPHGFITLSIDSYKLLVAPKAKRLNNELFKVWKSIKPFLVLASRKYGIKPPDTPPIQFEIAEFLWNRGYSLSLNIMVTDDILPLLVSSNMLLSNYSFMDYVRDRFIQIQFLLPKPMTNLLTTDRELLKKILFLWIKKSGVKVAVDQAFYMYINNRKNHSCLAGRKLLSIDPYRKIAPCSFIPHKIKWKPGELSKIIEYIRRKVLIKGFKCPYI